MSLLSVLSFGLLAVTATAADDFSSSDFHIQAQQLAAASAFGDGSMGIMEEKKYTCSRTKPCELGCCRLDDTGDSGNCGAGPEFCGAPYCHSECSWKSECDPGWGIQWSNMSTCPLNVCCSKFGFCGTTLDFCGGILAAKPECSVAAGSSDKRTIGYYEGWNGQRSCGHMPPSEIPLGYYTHIFYSFALVDPHSFHIAPMDAETASHYDEVTALKAKQDGLQVWIAIGGWAMNDPGPFRTAFSDLAKSEANQDAFFDSLVTFLLKHNFDGVDIDWEYPVAEDRGGIEADFKNFVNLMKRMRERLNRSGKKFGISITLPASYWYLRGFDIVGLEPHVDFFNVMTYDIHGTWDSTVKSMGPYAFAHTNLTEIDMGLELLWRNNINPERVNMGLGFYGRSFTMKDPSCMHAGCEFTSGAKGGECTGTPGVLSAAEIVQILKRSDAKMTLDEAAAVQIVTWDTNQWVSWDDKKTLKMKQDFANRRCLGGTMVWAIDLDDGTLIDELGSNLNRPKAMIYESKFFSADGETYNNGAGVKQEL